MARSGRYPRWNRRLFVLVIVLGALVAPTARAGLGDIPITGTVRDALRAPIAAARISDGRKVVYSDTQGRYTIEEPIGSGFSLTVEKTGFEKASYTGTALPGTIADFTLLWALTSDVSPRAFKLPKTLQVSVRSYAPPDSCVTWMDVTSGANVQLTLSNAVPGGESTWTGSFSVPPASDGLHAHRAIARYCADSTALTKLVEGAYTVDSVGPLITDLTPLDGNNTMFTSQPLLAKVIDPLAGVDPATIAFVLSDETAGSSRDFGSGAISFNSSTGWAKTSDVPLQVGHVYRLSAAASDRAGNESSRSHGPAAEGGGFFVTSVSLNGAGTSIPATQCAVGDQIGLDGKKTATCTNVPVRLAPTSLTLGGTRHDGIGVVRQTVDLNSAIVKTTIAGLPQQESAYQPGDPAWAPRTLEMTFQVPDPSTASATYGVSAPTDSNIGTLTVKVPPTWSSAVLEMTSVTSRPSSPACKDPSPSTVECGTDPVFSSQPLWDPGITGSRFASCSDAVSHKERITIIPGSDRVLNATVDTTRLQVASAMLHYSVGGGPVEIMTLPGSGASSYSFTIPGGLLSEGATLDYAFEIRGTFTQAQCSHWGAAVVPSLSGFHSVATVEIDPLESPYVDAVARVAASLGSQPEFAGSTSPEPICAKYFETPTPCQIYDGQGTAAAPLTTITIPTSVNGEVSAQSSDPYCQFDAPSYVWRKFVYSPQGNVTGLRASDWRTDRTVNENHGELGLEARAATSFFSGAWIDWTAESGFGWAFTGVGSGFPAAVWLEWQLEGQRTAGAGGADSHATVMASADAHVSLLSPSGSRQTDTPSGYVGGLDTPSGVNSPIGWQGLGYAGINPYKDPEYRYGTVFWNNFFFTNNQAYEFFIRLRIQLDVGTKTGGAAANLSMRRVDANHVHPGHERFDWRFKTPRILVQSLDPNVSLPAC